MTFSRDGFWSLLRAEPQPRLRLVSEKLRAADGYVVEQLQFMLPGGEPVRGIVTRPATASGLLPGLLYMHSHGGQYGVGADELLQGQSYIGALGPVFAAAGYVTLAIDMPLFGERATVTESALSKALLWRGKTLMGQMLAELTAALGYLAGRPDVDPSRIGGFGMSMGSTHGFMLAALDDRLKAVAHLCCYADYGVMIDLGAHDGHGHYMTIPGLVPAMSVGEICGAIAPRPQLCCVGLADSLTPPAAIDKAQAETEAAYRAAGHPERFEIFRQPGIGHQETPEMRQKVLRFLAENLLRQGG